MPGSETSLVFRGVRPLQRLGSVTRKLALGDLFPALLQKAPTHLRVIPPDAWPGDAQRGRDMIAGVFRFAGHTVAREGLSWEPSGVSPEWIAALHGFEWLRDLRSAGGDRARRMAREMAALWMSQYPKYHETAWRADITGARLTAWIAFHEFFCASADEDFRRDYFASLAAQTRHLERALPGELIGLPLMKALRGLAYACLAIDEDTERLERTFSLILEQIGEQILPDGTHISRSPRQTFEFLQCLVDLRTALLTAKMELPGEIQHAIDRVAPAVRMFRHGDGGLAQFNGGQEGNAHLVEITLMHSGARGKAMGSLPQGGYERLCQGRASLIMDTGAALSSAYGDRAHAGLLAFEYAFGRERVVVNCGTSEADGKWRRVLRSTLAHSTLSIEGRNACTYPGEGRISTRPAVRAKRIGDERVEAEHDGYKARCGIGYARRLSLLENGDVLRGEEELTGRSGTPFAVRLHLHPDIQVWREEDALLLRSRGGVCWRFTARGAAAEIEESVYVSADENPQAALQIVLSGETDVSPTVVAWELRRV